MQPPSDQARAIAHATSSLAPTSSPTPTTGSTLTLVRGAARSTPAYAEPSSPLLAPRHALAPSPVDPYGPIEKRPLFAPDRMRSKAFSVRLHDHDYPQGWREVGIVSEDYLLVPNSQVRDLALDIIEAAGGEWTTTREFFDAKRYAFALSLQNEHLVNVQVGDALGLGLLFENSYDGSRRLSASLFVNRLVCSNGMMAPSVFKRVSFKHTDAARDWEQAIATSLQMIETAGPALGRFAQAMQVLSNLYLTTSELSVVRSRMLPDLGVTHWGKVVDRWLLHEERTAWGLLNAATQVLWHNPKPTLSDLGHNEYVVKGMLAYARRASGTEVGGGA